MRNKVRVLDEVGTNDRAPSEDKERNDGREGAPVTAHDGCRTIEGADEDEDAAAKSDKQPHLVVGAPDLGDLELDDAADSDKSDGEDGEDDVGDGLHDGLLDKGGYRAKVAPLVTP